MTNGAGDVDVARPIRRESDAAPAQLRPRPPCPLFPVRGPRLELSEELSRLPLRDDCEPEDDEEPWPDDASRAGEALEPPCA